jgi:hypothetical protein
MIKPFNVWVAGDRLFRITPLDEFPEGNETYVPVDCRDVRSTMEAQSIVEAHAAGSRETLLADGQTRDAIASAYLSATRMEATQGQAVLAILPDDFTIVIA